MPDFLRTVPRPLSAAAGVVLLAVAVVGFAIRPEFTPWLRPVVSVAGYGLLAGGAWLLALALWPRPDAEE